jgi:transcriptional regulator with XRE-family HTH domain
MKEQNDTTIFKYRHDLIIELRRARRLNQRDLAKKAGLTNTTVSNAENGQDIKVSTLTAIARALDVDPRIFLDVNLKLNLEDSLEQAIATAA